MKKEVLAIDLDDVVLATAEPLQEFYNNSHGANLTLSDYYSKDLAVLRAPDLATAIKRFNVYLESEEFFNLPPTQEAVRALQVLDDYYDLHIVTGRNSVVEEATTLWLAEHFPGIFKGAVFTSYYNQEEGVAVSTKAEACRQIGAGALIEDHLGHALEVAAGGVDVLLFGSYPWNQAEELPPRVQRVSGWLEVVKLLVYERS